MPVHSELTPFGREAVERARQLVQAADDLRESGQALAQGMRGRTDMLERSLRERAIDALAGRSEAPALPIVRRLLQGLLQGGREWPGDQPVADQHPPEETPP